jgi:hypothetical protein
MSAQPATPPPPPRPDRTNDDPTRRASAKGAPRWRSSRTAVALLGPPPQDKEPMGWVGTDAHFAWLELIVRAVVVLNVIDAVLTMLWIDTGMAVEANPFLRELAHDFPVSFVAAKMALVSFGTWLLWRQRRRPLAVIAIFIAFLAYYFLLIHHLRAFKIVFLTPLLGGG